MRGDGIWLEYDLKLSIRVLTAFYNSIIAGRRVNAPMMGLAKEQQARVMAEGGEGRSWESGRRVCQERRNLVHCFLGFLPLLLDQTIASSSRYAH